VGRGFESRLRLGFFAVTSSGSEPASFGQDPTQAVETATVTYELVTIARGGKQRIATYASEEELRPGDVIRFKGRDWLVERIEDGEPPRAIGKPARYRLRLAHPDGGEEVGAFRRYRPEGPRLGHALTTLEDGQPISWEVTDEELAFDDDNEPYLDLTARRDFAEAEDLPDHELEHLLAWEQADFPEGAIAMLREAEGSGLSVELVALEAGEAPDWEAAERYIDALIFEEVEDDLFELCGVDPDNDRRDTWLPTVKERLHEDRQNFRSDIEGNHDEIEEWEYRDGRVFTSVGREEDEADPLKGHGWMCRLLDASALGAAGFDRVRKAEISPEP
jgi:hypothetical protein